MRVLVIDDSKVSREMIMMHLRKAGIEDIDEAKDGPEALVKIKSLAKGEKYDVITLDVNMPKIGGIAMIKEIKALARDSKIIMCTSQNDARTVQAAIGFGVQGFIVKPFTAEKLLETLWASLKK